MLCLLPLANAADRLGVDITTHLGDQQVYLAGDELSFFVSLDQAAYLLIIYQDAEDNLIQLLPNQLLDNAQFPQGLFQAIPSAQAPFVFQIQPPFGQERIKVFAAEQTFPKLPGTRLANGMKQLQGTLREQEDYLRRYFDQAGVTLGESETRISTRAR